MPAPKDPVRYELWKQRISQTSKGRKFTDETKAKMSAARLRTESQITEKQRQERRRIFSIRGRRVWDALSENEKASRIAAIRIIAADKSRREKLSVANKKFWESLSAEEKDLRINNPDKLEKLSRRTTERWKSMPAEKRNRLREMLSKAAIYQWETMSAEEKLERSRRMQDVSCRVWASLSEEEKLARIQYTINAMHRGLGYVDTSIERAVHKVLDALNVTYQKQKWFGRYKVDIVLPERKSIIECDGTYWHGTDKAKIKDAAKDKFLENLGFKVIRLKEEDINSDVWKTVRDTLDAA